MQRAAKLLGISEDRVAEMIISMAQRISNALPTRRSKYHGATPEAQSDQLPK